MKPIVKWISAVVLMSCTEASIAQTKMTMTVNNQESDLFGYAFDSANGGTPKEINLFGPMQNAASVFQLAYLSSNPIPEVDISISDPNRGPENIKLKQVTVLGFKQYVSTYTDGYFAVSSGGNVNSAATCKFQSIEVESPAGKSGVTKTSKETPTKIGSGNSSNDKFEMMPARLKGVTGQISVSLPADVKCEIKVYDPTENDKYLGSFNRESNILMFPGKYDVTLSDAEVKNVTVETGNETRINAGILSLVSPIEYKLYDQSKTKYIGTYKGPQKIGLPVGNFQLSINNRFQQITIKNGEETEM